MDWVESVDWLPLYAAVIATLALAWQVFRWWRDREPGLEVEISKAHSAGPPREEGSNQLRTAELLVIEVRNLSGTRRANVTSVGVDVEDAHGRHIISIGMHGDGGATIPGVIEPNDSGLICHPLRRDEQDMLPAPPDARAYGWAWTSTGRDRVTSPRYRLQGLPRREPMRGEVPEPRWLWGRAQDVSWRAY